MGVALLAVCIGQASVASDTTTGEVGNVAGYMIDDAKCAAVGDAVRGINKGGQTTKEVLMVILTIVYQAGYSDGKGIAREKGRNELLFRCLANPELPFAAR